MDFVGFLLLIALLYGIFKILKTNPTKNTPVAAVEAPPTPLSNPNQDAASAIQKIINACMNENESATLLLSIVASADGRISRDELKIIAAFCMKHGALIEAEWMQSLNRLNSGVNMKVTGDKDALKHLAAIGNRPTVYLAGLYGAVIALTIRSDKQSGVVRDVIGTLESMLETKTA